MKTLVIDESKMTKWGCDTEFLSNREEIEAMIQETQAQLLPCAHCGSARVRIIHVFRPCCMFEEDQPHKLVARCLKGHWREPVGYCACQTGEWFAKDDESDFRETLRRIVESWNRRPQ